MRECKNPTCDRPAEKKSGNWQTYCSEKCRRAMRTQSKGRQVPDLWLPMRTWWQLEGLAARERMTVRDYILMLIDEETNDGLGSP